MENTFFTLLACLFIGLKLTGVISWSWLWVLAPLWMPVTIGILLILAGMLVSYYDK